MRRAATVAAAMFAIGLVGCATQPSAPSRRPAAVRARIVQLLPPTAPDREGWAADIASAFSSLGLDAGDSELCATIAIAGQESNFASDPAVPGLGRIARAEIDRRAAEHDIPELVVRAALSLHSSNGKSYADRIAGARTERELSLVYEDMIGRVPLGRRLFADSNPVRTGGPMQVSVSFAEQFARDHDYPYPVETSIRHEVFSRRGGVYFGVAHLLGYRASYDRMIYRFADYNAGFYASRNAAFQNAVSLASGIPLARDGDLIAYDGNGPGTTERAVRALSKKLDLDDGEIHRALVDGESADFERSRVYERVFAYAQRVAHRKLPRAQIPEITLKSPKITRRLTTEWFATRVDARYRQCMARRASQADA